MEWNFEQVAGPFGFYRGSSVGRRCAVIYRYAGGSRHALRSQDGGLR